jgi:hypothetical protein
VNIVALTDVFEMGFVITLQGGVLVKFFFENSNKIFI